jgi:hypothetical protein
MFDRLVESIKNQLTLSNLLKFGIGLAIILVIGFLSFWAKEKVGDHVVVNKISKSLSVESRTSQILVKSNTFDEQTGRVKATLKYQEWDARDKPLEPKLIILEGTQLQLITTVIQLPKGLKGKARKLKGKKLCLFLKIVTGENEVSRELEIVELGGVPDAYKIGPGTCQIEENIWESIWENIIDDEGKLVEETKVTNLPITKLFFLPGTTFNLTLHSSGKVEVATRYPSYAGVSE